MIKQRLFVPYIAILVLVTFFSFLVNKKVGFVMVGLIATAAVVYFVARTKHSGPVTAVRATVPIIPKQVRISSEYEVDPSHTVMPVPQVRNYQLGAPKASKPEERPLAAKLIATLRSLYVDVNSPVFFRGDDSAVTVREMVTEIASVAKSHGKSEQEMIEMIPTVYEYLWVFIDEVCDKYGKDGEAAIKSALANKCLVVTFPEQAIG
jgi:hypothetical protein